MVLPTIHHKINNNYIDIDGTSVVLDTNGKLKAQADIPASLSTTNITATSSLNANRLTGIKSSARYIDFNDNMIKFGLGGYTLWTFDYTNIIPYQDNTISVGSSAKCMKDVYMKGKLTDGTNEASLADLAALITYAKGQGWIQ